MQTQKHHHGRCSFELPPGFALDREASSLAESPAYQEHTGKTPPVNLSIRKEGIVPAQPAATGNGEPDAAAFSITISLLGRPARFSPPPMDLLNEESALLKDLLDGYETNFTRAETISGKEAAASQSSFAAAGRLFKLSLAWTLEKELLLISAVVPQKLVAATWTDMRQLAESITLA